MPLPSLFRRLKADTSSVDELSAELGRQDTIRAQAEAALYDLGAKRPGLLLDGSDAQLAKLDADLAAQRRALEQAEARIAALEPEWRAADERESAARADRERRERHAAAKAVRAEGVKILAAYDREAAALAAKLRRLVEIEAEIAATNLDLPADAAPIASAEPFNGRHAVPDTWGTHEVWIDGNGDNRGTAHPGQSPPGHGYVRRTVNDYTATPGTPGVPHRPLAGRVHLPALALDAAPHWAPGTPTPIAGAAAILASYGFAR